MRIWVEAKGAAMAPGSLMAPAATTATAWLGSRSPQTCHMGAIALFFIISSFFYAYWLCLLLLRNNQTLMAYFKWTIKYVRTLRRDGADKRAGARQSAMFNSRPSDGANLIII